MQPNPSPSPQDAAISGVKVQWQVISSPGDVLTVRSAQIPATIQERIANAIESGASPPTTDKPT